MMMSWAYLLCHLSPQVCNVFRVILNFLTLLLADICLIKSDFVFTLAGDIYKEPFKDIYDNNF